MHKNGSDDIAADKSRNYTSFGLESIKLFASTVHSPNAIEAKVLAQLSEDTSYRLRELIASSFQYTRHSKRFKLTCDDVNRALKASDSQAIYGFSGSESSKEIHVPEAGVFVTEDKPVDLVKISALQSLMASTQHESFGGRGGETLSEDEELRSNDSIDGKSNKSEKDFKRHDGTHLLVESTISGVKELSSLGVKLTIKKIRRQRRSVDEQYSSNGKSGRKWKKPKLQNFMECFTEECEDLLLEKVQTKGNLYSHRMVKKTLSLPYQPTSWYLLLAWDLRLPQG
uniref:TATA box binding protein associated factor (TAF) histone-like fold domain-containing protein n=1 Tax=Tetranychus urticae TaxID=32264 RepID=T1KXY7_TETUR